jgi:hypothetical protein
MAQVKISALTELLAASLDALDELPIVDKSAVQTKKVTIGSFDARYIVEGDIAAKGDLLVGTADNTAGILTVGANDTILVADSATGTGTKWATLSATGAVVLSTAPVTVSGTTDTLALTDNGKVNVYSNASLVTVTLPTDGSDDLPDGFECLLVAAGAGGLILSTAGITLIGSSPVTSAAQNESLFVKKTASANTWMVLGGAAPVLATIRVEDEGSSVVAAATALNFAGAGVTVTDAGSNEALVTISGGGSGDVATDAIWDAKGDLAGGTGANTAARLAVGANGTVLTADSAEVTGLKWAAAGSGAIRVEDEGTSIVAAATGINFAGAGVVVTDAGSNEALVTISGGGGGGGTGLGVVIYQDGNLLRAGLGF